MPEATAAVALLLERLPEGEGEALEVRLRPVIPRQFEPNPPLPLPAAAQLCRLYLQHPGLLPREVPDLSTLAGHIVETLALAPPMDRAELAELAQCQAEMEEVAALLLVLWDKHTDVLAAAVWQLKAELLQLRGAGAPSQSWRHLSPGPPPHPGVPAGDGAGRGAPHPPPLHPLRPPHPSGHRHLPRHLAQGLPHGL